jgi:trehalose/maltose hydrolase-like predicted phosphorylase
LNPEWKNATAASIEMIFEEFSDNEINELVNSTCQIHSNKLNGRVWLQTYLDYTIDFDPKVFFKLY